MTKIPEDWQLPDLVGALVHRVGLRQAQYEVAGALRGLLEWRDHPEMDGGPEYAVKFLREMADNIEQEGKR